MNRGDHLRNHHLHPDKTYFEFIQPLYSWREAKIANIAGEWRLPVLVMKQSNTQCGYRNKNGTRL